MREISVRQGSSTIHVICDAASARDCSIEKLQMLADQAEQILRGHIEALPPYALNDRGLKQAFSKTYATLREDPAFTQQEAAISAMVLIERPGEGQQVMAACVGDLLLYQTSPDSTGLLFRDPLCTESPLRPRKLSNALGFDVEPRVSTAKLSRHKLETWTVLSYGAASQLNTNQIRCIGLDPDHKVLGVSATLRRLNGSTHLLRARTLGCGTLVTQADSANHLYQLYSHPQKRWRLSTWAAAGVAAMVVMTGLQIGAHPCKATKAEMQLQSLEEEQAREIRHYVAWNSKQASPSFTAAADEEDDSPIQSRIEALRAKAARLQSEQENTVAIAAELERLQKEISRRDAIISDLQGARKDLQQLLKELNPNGKFASAEEEGAWLRTQVLTLKKELNERNAAVDELNTARNTLQQELANIKSAAVKLQDQFELTQVEKESLEQRLTRLNALREQEMEEQSGTLSALEQDYSKRLTELKAQLNNTQQALQDANRDITAKETEIAQLAETRTKLSQDLATSQHKLRLFEDGLFAVDQLEAKLADQTKSLDTLQKDYNSLRNDVANLHLAQADLLSEVQEQLAQASGNLAGDDEDLAELFATQDNLVRKLQRLESEQQDAFAFTRDAIEELREDVVNHDSRLAALQTGAQNSTAKTIEEATKRLATLEARFAERDQTLRALSNDQQYLVAALEEQSENLAQVYENIDEIAEAVQTRKSPEPNTSNATVDLEGKLKKQLNNLEEAWKAALAQIQDLSSTTQTLEGSLKQVRSEVDSLDVAQRGLGDWLEDQQGQLASLDGTLEKVARDEPQTRSPSNWQSALEDLQRGWEAKFDAQQQVIAALSEQLKRQNKAPKSIKSEVSATELQELRQLCLENRDTLNEFLTHRKTLTAELGATRKGLSDIEAKCTHLSDMESRLNTREQMLTDLSRSHATVESILRATQTKVALLQKEVERARASKDDQKQGETLVKSITKAQDSLIVDVATAKRKMEGLERKLELVKELEDKLREKDALLSNLDFNQRNLEKRLDTTQGKVSYLEKQLTTLERIDRQIGTLQRRVAAAE